MDVFPGHRALGRRLREPAVAIGNFDGVHRGHQRLFEEIRRLAAARGAESVALTFQPHPAKLLAPAFAPPLICTPDCKLRRIAAAGIDACVVEPFDAKLAAYSPTEFVDEVLAFALGAREIVVGHDFTFGKARAGDTRLLEQLGRSRGFALHVIAPVTVDGMVCSSTKVRQFVLEGRVEGAALLLGRDPEVVGTVMKGAGRGRAIGVPTANLRVETELLPAAGVYAGWAAIIAPPPGGSDQSRSGEPVDATALDNAARFKAAINLGSNPTFVDLGVAPGVAPGALSVEVHLLDYPGEDLYGARLVVGFRRRLRAERRFSSVEALVAQIREDIAASAAEAAAAPRRS